MKIMEIQKLWIRCLVAAEPKLGKDNAAIRHLLILTRVVPKNIVPAACATKMTDQKRPTPTHICMMVHQLSAQDFRKSALNIT